MADTTGLTNHMKDLLRGTNRIGITTMDFYDTVEYFNVARMPDWENGPEPYIGYILMSRPSLNVLVGLAQRGRGIDISSVMNYEALRHNSMSAALIADNYGQAMLRSLTPSRINPWLPIITTKAKSYAVNDIELKTVDKGNTYFGHVLKYGKHSEDHKVSGSITIDFRSDRYLSILKMMQIWMTYIYLVSKTDLVVPTKSDQMNAILDYAGSIYYLVTRRDGRELVYWEKLVGVFPTKLPLSVFSYNDSMILEDTVSIDFSYGIRTDPMDPSILMDINMLSGHSYQNIAGSMRMGSTYDQLPRETSLVAHAVRDGTPHRPSSVIKTQGGLDTGGPEIKTEGSQFIAGDVKASNPFIRMRKTGDLIKYYLCWEL